MAPDSNATTNGWLSPGHAVARELEAQIRLFLKLARRMRQQKHGQPDVDFVHDLRVGARRLLAALTIGEVMTEASHGRGKVFSRLRRRVKKPFRALGEVRDLEVAEEASGALQLAVPDFADVHAFVSEQLAEMRPEAMMDVRKRLLPEARSALKLRRKHVRSVLREVAPGVALHRLRVWLLEHQRQARRCLKRLNTHEAAAFHRLRISLKKLRYGCEFLAELDLKGIDRARAIATAELCRDMQQHLGAIQDDVVLLGFVDERLHDPVAAHAYITRRQHETMRSVLARRAELQTTLREAHNVVAVPPAEEGEAPDPG